MLENEKLNNNIPQFYHNWITSPQTQINKPEKASFTTFQSKMRFKQRVKSIWYAIVKLTAMFYALIISNFRAICSPNSDYIFYFLNSFTVIFFIYDFIQNLMHKKGYQWSLSSFVYFLAILFTFFDFGIFTINGFQYIEYTIYIKLLFLNDPLFHNQKSIKSCFAQFLTYFEQIFKKLKKTSKTPNFEIQKILTGRKMTILSNKIDEKVKFRKDFVKLVKQTSEKKCQNQRLLLLNQKNNLFQDFFIKNNETLKNFEHEVETQISLNSNAKSSEKVIRDQFKLKIIICQLIICFVIAFFYQNWIKYVSGFETLHSLIAFKVRENCAVSENLLIISDLISKSNLTNTDVLFTNMFARKNDLQNDLFVKTIFPENKSNTISTIMNNFRSYELLIVSSPINLSNLSKNQCYLQSTLNTKLYYQITALLNIFRTIIFVIILTFYTYLSTEKQIEKTCNQHNIAIEFCRRMRINIQEGGQLAFEYYQKMQQQKQLMQNQSENQSQLSQIESATFKVIETAAFLKIGFGQAGIDFIRGFLADEKNKNAREISAVISFVEIRQFDFLADKLGENVVDFLNEIAEIISNKIEKSRGFSNKNSEAYFLLIWKNDRSNENQLCQNAFYSIVEAIFEIHERSQNFCIDAFKKYGKLLSNDSFQNNSQMISECQNLNDNSSKDYNNNKTFKFKIGVGMHFGNVTEGAVGSSYKIDISYISKEVNMASRIQSATKQFGLRLLLSDKFVANLGIEYLRVLRKVDRVFLKGSAEAVQLFTYDGILHGFMNKQSSNKWVKILDKNNSFRENDPSDIGHFNTTQFDNDGFEESLKMSNLLLFWNDDYSRFLELWNQALNEYLDGNFLIARSFFEKLSFYCKTYEDGSADCLVDFLSGFKFDGQINWKGARKLENK